MNWLSDFLAVVADRIRSDSWLYAAVGIYTAIGLAMMAATDHFQLEIYGSYIFQFMQGFLILMPLVAVTFDLALVRIRFGRRQKLAGLRMFSPQRIGHLLAGMLLMMSVALFQGTFTSIKNLMPVLRGGFLYDRAQANFDHWLWFGVQPWKVLYALSGTQLALQVVEWNYGLLWFIVCFGALFFAATSPKAKTIRTRYFVMFMLVWIVCGNILAGIFISAGPVFSAGVTGNAARFAQQQAFLATSLSSHSTLVYQKYLWALHQHGLSGFGSGVSAFPSVHVGVAAMNAFFAAEISWTIGTIAFTYLGVIAFSSIFLGWHYSVDGLAAFVVVGIMHYALHWLMKPRSENAASVLRETAMDAPGAISGLGAS